ncbi:phosphotransferase [Bifidobacterium dolichotidis]|nr:phosphotransferase [Bifidobacterium dolichotidis]
MNDYKLAAMASYAMPNLSVTGVGKTGQENDTDEEAGIKQALIQDAAGRMYNVYVSQTRAGKKRLRGRAQAAIMIERSREMYGLGFDIDHAVAFRASKDDDDISRPSVLLTAHPDGMSRPLSLLTIDDCASIGTAIGAIHKLRPRFVVEAKYPAFATKRIQGQLTSWIRNLKAQGHVPAEITDSWARIMNTEGMWNFETVPVHGGFSDGDILFDGSMITTITNWQELQINDPARDLAWIFSKLDETHRNAVLTAYGRILGNRLDDLIMLRANLWVQMGQVGEFIGALKTGDNTRIMQFKSQVDRLAHQIAVSRHHVQARTGQLADDDTNTLTVNTLLEARANQQHKAQAMAAGMRPHTNSAVMDATVSREITPSNTQDHFDDTYSSDATNNPDATGGMHVVLDETGEASVTGATEVLSAPVMPGSPVASVSPAASDDTASASFRFSTGDGEYVQVSDITGEVVAVHPSSDTQAKVNKVSTNTSQHRVSVNSAETIAAAASMAQDADKAKSKKSDAETLLIPLLEREERALRDAQSGLKR